MGYARGTGAALDFVSGVSLLFRIISHAASVVSVQSPELDHLRSCARPSRIVRTVQDGSPYESFFSSRMGRKRSPIRSCLTSVHAAQRRIFHSLPVSRSRKALTNRSSILWLPLANERDRPEMSSVLVEEPPHRKNAVS